MAGDSPATPARRKRGRPRTITGDNDIPEVGPLIITKRSQTSS